MPTLVAQSVAPMKMWPSVLQAAEAGKQKIGALHLGQDLLTDRIGRKLFARPSNCAAAFGQGD
jgi:hypothetical protein